MQLKISFLGRARYIAEPVPPKKSKVIEIVSTSLLYAGMFIVPIILWMILRNFLVGFLRYLVGFVAIFAALYVVLEILDENGREKAKKKAYEKSFKEYQHALDCDSARLVKEERQKKILQENLRQLEEQNKSMVQTLSNLYSLNIIYEKYRSFTRVCTIYECICSGRCTTLGERFGNDGAYNLLEQEERQEKIILKLDQILQKLDEIKAGQYILYHAIQEGNQKMDAILSGIHLISNQIDQAAYSEGTSYRLEELEKSSAVAAYHAERIDKGLSYMNRVNYFSGKYDRAGMFRQRPPV